MELKLNYQGERRRRGEGDREEEKKMGRSGRGEGGGRRRSLLMFDLSLVGLLSLCRCPLMSSTHVRSTSATLPSL